ncbi:sugar transporter, partial [Streptomyces sp. NRRL F-6602]
MKLQRKNRLRALSLGVVAVSGALALTACGSDDDSSKGASGKDGYEGQTLTVWVMDGSAPDTWQKDLTAAFEKKTKAKVKFEIQQWNGIQQKLTTSLSESNPPDVFEVGNTQTASYAQSGGLAELGDLKSSVGSDWTESINKA